MYLTLKTLLRTIVINLVSKLIIINLATKSFVAQK
jgi:hypothetical protein